jgi:hypothetical protein
LPNRLAAGADLTLAERQRHDLTYTQEIERRRRQEHEDEELVRRLQLALFFETEDDVPERGAPYVVEIPARRLDDCGSRVLRNAAGRV